MNRIESVWSWGELFETQGFSFWGNWDEIWNECFDAFLDGIFNLMIINWAFFEKYTVYQQIVEANLKSNNDKFEGESLFLHFTYRYE